MVERLASWRLPQIETHSTDRQQRAWWTFGAVKASARYTLHHRRWRDGVSRNAVNSLPSRHWRATGALQKDGVSLENPRLTSGQDDAVIDLVHQIGCRQIKRQNGGNEPHISASHVQGA
jgi:hypothetical protein